MLIVEFQQDACNRGFGLLTQLDMAAFFAALRALESALGREPTRVRWGPRRIDLDLLLFDAERLDGAELTLPHPGIVQRNFVLYPLLEVAPELNVPDHGRVAELAARVGAAGMWRLDNNPKTHGA